MHMKKIFLFLVLLMTVFSLSACKRRGPAPTEATEAVSEEQADETEHFIGTVKEIDLLLNVITFVDVLTDQEYALAYNGGVMITNKYDGILAISQLAVGEIVDVSYDMSQGNLVSIHINENAMRYENINGLEIDILGKTLNVAGENLQYSDNVVVYDGQKLIEISALSARDELVLRVYDGKLCSATVEEGHGYVKLINYDTYIGGMIEIGYDVIVPVTENMVLTVKEGEYELKITKGSHMGTRYVTVIKDEEITVDLSALQIAPEQTGAAVISVLPEEAEAKITVDGTKYKAGEEIELVYGKHILRINAEGYEPVATYLVIEQAYKKYEYTLKASGSASDSTTEENRDTTATSEASTEENTNPSSEDTTGDGTEEKTTEEKKNQITINAPIGAKLYVDGEYVGVIPCSFTKTEGKHIITLTMEGCVTATYILDVEENGKDETYSYDELELLGSSNSRLFYPASTACLRVWERVFIDAGA